MIFLIFLAHPKPSHPEYGVIDGAYVACWVNEPTEAIADRVAREEIDAAGWDIEERDEAHEVEREDYAEGSVPLERFDQAATDGCVLEFNRWPVGAPEE